jgi:hypothetical protein
MARETYFEKEDKNGELIGYKIIYNYTPKDYGTYFEPPTDYEVEFISITVNDEEVYVPQKLLEEIEEFILEKDNDNDYGYNEYNYD